MNRHTLRVLEFEEIRTDIQNNCMTEEGRERLHRERIQTDSAEVRKTLELVGAVRRCLEVTTRFPELSFPPANQILSSLEKEGAVLEPEQIAALASHTRSASLLSAYLTTASGELGREDLHPLIEQIPDLRLLSDRLFRYVDPDGTIREREIPELKRIRAQINRAGQALQAEAAGLLSRTDMKRYWNTTVPTQREGRTVLALKADHRGKVKGIVHEVSATGATIFVEPEVLVERNNAVTEAENRYRIELRRILRELSVVCREHLGPLRESLDAVIEIDRLYCRARYGLTNECLPAAPSPDGIVLRQARHPLLGKEAVPITIEFPPGKRVLVVTGPNTGGKTVSMKTVGLLALMNQFGVEIPAGPGTELPVFSGIYADIGDEQSIEQSLSTFSGHMRNISRILSATDGHALILLDELGSGTDPEEGGALAMGILDEILERGPFAIVTTHHGALKHYGFSREAATNASVEFDLKSLRPTYRIVPGVPGSSHAIDVAAHMGLLRKVTRAARKYLSGEEYDTGRLIRTLTDREQELHRERERMRAREQELENAISEMDSSRREMDRRESELKKGRLRELESWSARMRSELENLVREIREGELTREKRLGVKEFIRKVGDDLNEQREALKTTPAATAGSQTTPDHELDTNGLPPAANDDPAQGGGAIETGRRVRVVSTGKEGIVLRESRSGRWQVRIGSVRMDIEASDLLPLAPAKPESASVAISGLTASPDLELDLRGYRLEDALDEVERQLDQALLGGMQRFGIIHGTGEGVLQKGIRDLLQRSEHVRKFSFARPEDGGFGKTIVEL